jgi:glyoxylase-like metal-dependent hydrolase (beta-lactamase superfamily II)
LNPDPLDPQRRFPSLGEYLVSLARLRELAPTLIKTAHGDDVTDYEEYFFALTPPHTRASDENRQAWFPLKASRRGRCRSSFFLP